MATKLKIKLNTNGYTSLLILNYRHLQSDMIDVFIISHKSVQYNILDKKELVKFGLTKT